MGIELTDLSPAAQAQALQKLNVQLRARQADKTDKPNKYHNIPVERAGIRFDSKKEARRFDELSALAAAGAIRDLRLQVDFTLQEGYTTATGERVRAIRYRADFTYQRRAEPDAAGIVYWLPVVEDVKSRATRTPEYRMKRKMMQDRHGIEIQEV